MRWVPLQASITYSRRRAPSLLLAVVAYAALIAGAPTARAADDAELLIQQGVQMRKEGDKEGALRVFTRAYSLAKTPRAAAQLGLCEYSLSRWVDAEMHLAEALRARNDAWIERARPELKRSLDEVRTVLGWLQVLGRPVGAEVELAGRTVGKLPLKEPIRWPAGEVHLRVSADGYTSFRRNVVIPPMESAQVVIDLDKNDAPAVARVAPEEERPLGPPPPIDVRSSSAGGTNWRWPAAWVSGGFAVLLTAGGIVGAVVHNSKIKEFDGIKKPQSNEYQCSTGYVESGGSRCAGLLAEANQAKMMSTGSFIGAGVAAILSTVFFATAPAASERLALSACAPTLGGGVQGATCAFRF